LDHAPMDTRYSVLSRSLGTGSLVIMGPHERQWPKWHTPRPCTVPARVHHRGRPIEPRPHSETPPATRLRIDELEYWREGDFMEPLREALCLIERQTELENAMCRPAGYVWPRSVNFSGSVVRLLYIPRPLPPSSRRRYV
jgi:hypothetical protein